MKTRVFSVCMSIALGWASLSIPVSATEARPAAGATAGAEQVRDAEFSLAQRMTSPLERRRYADEAVTELAAAAAKLEKQLKAAREAGDVGLASCLNEKLARLKSLWKVAETAAIVMGEAVAQGQTEEADHQFRKVVIARIKGRELLGADCEDLGPSGGQGDVTLHVEGGDHGLEGVVDQPIDPIDPLEPIDLPAVSP